MFAQLAGTKKTGTEDRWCRPRKTPRLGMPVSPPQAVEGGEQVIPFQPMNSKAALLFS